MSFNSAVLKSSSVIGTSTHPVRIGARVQILENIVLHLLPDNELVIEHDVIIGPGAMIHGCHIEAGSVVEPAAIVCDYSRVGAGSLIRGRASSSGPASRPGRSRRPRRRRSPGRCGRHRDPRR